MWGQFWGTMIWGAAPSVPLMGPLGWMVLLVALLGLVWLHRRKFFTGLPAVLLAAAVLAIPVLAIAGVPNVFVNGTVADADAVNDNFDAITDESSKTHLTRTGSSAGTSIAVDQVTLLALCGDADGCEIQLVSQFRNGPIDFPNPAPPKRLFLNPQAPSRWTAIGAAGSVNGIDADGAVQHVTSDVAGDCFFTDGQYAGFTGSDPSVGFHLLVWNGASNPVRECRLTLVD